ncbi:MAG TPA: putative sulfate exporter family transporter, partial [Flavobacteriales bacterium]|nr:putative sulfate exporter family transporter [Flavobacteriales bacterium]
RGWREHIRLPWYLWGFIAITVLTSLVQLPPALLAAMDTAGKLALTIALAAIGLKVSFRELYFSGRKGLVFGLLVFVIQLGLVARLMGLVG